ncbi:pullulanase [Halobacillus amylolyticus]|uniref:pullulanase n=1 Tax=Halobacillus amylolyticus TaxID=2932259 RepID=A0ABY4H8R4_9BACI|nr:pullulanase [Halobacillus amylolyticus]UOR10999.1 pullulanase [Halobacillus amylolyticus]
MRKVLGKSVLIMLAFVMVYSSSGSIVASEFSKDTASKSLTESPIPEGHIRVHYQRTDSDYSGWGLHLWNQDGDNPAIDFVVDWSEPIMFDQKSDWGVYKDIKVSNIKNGLNFIVHKGDTKDVVKDRSFPTSGEREFWLVQGQEKVYLEEPETSSELTYVEITSKSQMTGYLNGSGEELSRDELQIVDQRGNEIGIKSVKVSHSQFTLTTTKNLDLLKSYTVSLNGTEKHARISWELMDKEFAYKGNDLGATLHDNGEATLKFWSPPATNVSVILYDKDNQYKVIKESTPMSKGENGVWKVQLDQANTGVSDLSGYYYQYQIHVYGQTNIGLDPYAKSMAAWSNEDGDSVGKAAIIDPSSIGPQLDYADIDGFENREDAIIWEAHVRDFTSDPSIDSDLKSQFGTFNAFAEKLDYIKELGVTHIQLLPVMKYYFGNELNSDEREMEYSSQGNNYNWGYDPHSYFSPTGMYSEQPKDPKARIAELKNLIKEIHKRDMGVILDVVYNHTAKVSILEDLVPNYYHFMGEEGNPKVGYGGGKVGTTHAMSRKLMVDSIKYLVEEFKVDGFRFDLMGDLDAESVQIAYNEAKKLNPNILMIGEGWRTFVGDGGPEDEVMPADQDWMNHTNGVSVFSDEIRNELKSGFGIAGEPRFITGGARDIRTIFNNIKAQPGNIKEDDPGDVVQYIAAHDNLTLHDVIAYSIKKDPAEHEEEIQKRIRLGNSMILTSQGIAFLHAGQEYGRTKQWKGEEKPKNSAIYMVDQNGEPFDHPYFIDNSYDSSDRINMFDWSKVTEKGVHKETMEYTKGLIELRRSTNAFRLGTMDEVNSNISMIDVPEIDERDMVIAYKAESTDDTGNYFVFVNADNQERKLTLHEYNLAAGKVIVDDDEAGKEKVSDRSGFKLNANEITLEPLTTVVVKCDSPGNGHDPCEKPKRGKK